MNNMNNRNRGACRRWSRALVPVLFVLGLSVPALAVDGVIEINQAKVLAGGVTTGDNPGFPVHINAPGSYRLTGDLSVAAGFDGIFIGVSDVTLDFNGFSLVGGGGAISDGISMPSGGRNVEIKNGTVRGFSRFGVFTNANTHDVRLIGVRVVANAISGIELQGQGNLVDGCYARANTGLGIRVGAGSLVIDSISIGNTGLGLVMDATAGYRSNVLTSNNGGNGNPQATATGLQLGSNVCGTDLVCP